MTELVVPRCVPDNRMTKLRPARSLVNQSWNGFDPFHRSCNFTIMHLLKFRIVIVLYLIVGLAAQGISTIKYFRSEEDFLRGTSMKATEINGNSYLQVLYNNLGQLISKSTIAADGEILSETVFEYADDGSLDRKSERDGMGKTIRMYVYGAEEMSETFINYAFPHRAMTEFQDRVTIYSYDEKGEVTEYLFTSIDKHPFGAIRLSYFKAGPLAEERWLLLPGELTVRLFDYDYDPVSRAYVLTEYDSTGTEVSRVGLVLPTRSVPELDELLTGVTIKSGNVLEESAEIVADIQMRLKEGWIPSDEGVLLEEGVLSSPDLIYLSNRDTLQVTLVEVNKDFVRFMFFGEHELLTMPISQVQEIERRDGKIIYPVIY